MKVRIAIGTLALWMVCHFSIAQTNIPCVLKHFRDSIKVYTCKETKSRYRSLRAEFTVKSTFSQLASMVFDIENYHDWQEETVEAYVIRKVSEKEILYYTEAAAPYPASNRDFVIRLTMDQDPKTKELWIRAVSEPTGLPVKKDVIRVPFSDAHWRVKKLNADYLSIVYTVEIDLGGAVPPWLVNIVSHQAPVDTFKALRQKIGKYKGKKVEFIVE